MKRSSFAGIFSAFAAGALLTSVSFAAAEDASGTGKPLSQADVEAIVKKVIQDNPELIMGSLQNYQASKVSRTVSKVQDSLKTDRNSPSIGNPKGDVTIVEFFDYHCGYCKQFMPTVTGLLKDDGNVRIVFAEFPILSQDSILAARAALAVNKIDKAKYIEYHKALMKMSGEFTVENLTNKAVSIGIDEAAFKKAFGDPALVKTIEANKQLARDLDIHGTPSMIIGDKVISGAVKLDELKGDIAAARQKS